MMIIIYIYRRIACRLKYVLRQRLEKRNALESYVYQVRDWMSLAKQPTIKKSLNGQL